ncbi:hypothetical protein, partial [Acinetobacter baumannii]|uniref:hypothetical protein n=1 Tax=Acinetobacter baumannii TaxID=470 RepID=UPI001BB46937
MKQLLAHPQGVDLGPLQPSLGEGLRKRGRRIDLLPLAIRQELPNLMSVFPAEVPAAPASTADTSGQAPHPT